MCLQLIKILSSLLPVTMCTLCRQPGPHILTLCPACLQNLPWNTPACANCAMPLSSQHATVCARCLQQPPLFDRSYAALRYEHPIRAMIHALKFQRRGRPSRLLAQLLARYLTRYRLTTALPQCLIPMPLHRQRLCRRGYNQTVEIGRELSKLLQLPLLRLCCRRRKGRPAQTTLSRQQRWRNLHAEFTLNQPLAATHVALLDDVITTGATAQAASHALRQGGAQFVEVWSVARTPLNTFVQAHTSPVRQGFSLLELLIVITLIGLLAVLALPRYTDYTQRARVLEGLNLVQPLKLAISEAQAAGTLQFQAEDQHTNEDVGYVFHPTPTVEAIDLVPGAVIRIRYAIKAMAGQAVMLFLVPQAAQGSIRWHCYVNNQHNVLRVPQGCRHVADTAQQARLATLS